MFEANEFESLIKTLSSSIGGNADAKVTMYRDVMIYGAGNCGKDVQRILSNEGIAIAGFLDSNIAQGTVISGARVFHPEDSSIGPELRAEALVIIAVFNRDADILSIQHDLEKYGYRNIKSFVEFHRQFPSLLGDRFWLTSLGDYRSHAPAISEGLPIWHDDKSRALYTAIIQFRLTGNYRYLPAPEKGMIYFDAEMPRWKSPLRFIDCGSFNGDTLKELKRAYGVVHSIAAFEPDMKNFADLCSRVKTDGPFADSMVLFPCGTWSSTTQLKFASDNSESSCLSPHGSFSVQCVALDDAAADFHATLIKLDIEGAEYETLLGAREIIRKNKPGLAISVYHRPADLWRIPALLNHWGLGYDYYLRMYGHSGFDLVLYAMQA